MDGWIKLHRKIISHWIWADERKLKWWIDILMEANHKDQKVPIGFKILDCKRGQSVNSLQTWGKRWDVDKSVVRNFFAMLENDNAIKTENVTVTTRLTVCNYDLYQSDQHASDTHLKRKPTRSKTEDNPNKNVKNVKEWYRKQIKLSNDDKNYKSFATFLFNHKSKDDPMWKVLKLDEQIGWDEYRILDHKIKLMGEKKGYSGTLKQKVEGFMNGTYKNSCFFDTMNTWINGDAQKIGVKLPGTDEIRKHLRK